MAKKKKTETFALVPGHGWFVVDRITGYPDDGKPWFIGTGIGYDINRLVVFARTEGDAEEIAEEKWPDRMGDRVSRRDEEEVEDSGQSTFFAKNSMWTYKESRIFTVAKRIEKGRPLGGSDAALRSGEVIRYT